MVARKNRKPARNPTSAAKPAKLHPKPHKKISGFTPCKIEHKNYYATNIASVTRLAR